MGFGVAPTLDGEIKQCGTIFRSYRGEELMKCSGILEEEFVSAIEDLAALGVGFLVEEEDAGNHRCYFSSCFGFEGGLGLGFAGIETRHSEDPGSLLAAPVRDGCGVGEFGDVALNCAAVVAGF